MLPSGMRIFIAAGSGGRGVRTMQVHMSLVDYLFYRLGCAFLSDLHYLTGTEREKLCGVLRGISPDAASLQEWNDALGYLTNAAPEPTASAAKERLLDLLSHDASVQKKATQGRRATAGA